MLTVKPPQLNFNSDGTPSSIQFDDPYFSLDNAAEESRYVFIQGNHLPERWCTQNQDLEHFTIAELGFGFGLNFITSCEIWLKNNSPGHLHYISLEKYPVKKNDLVKLHSKLELSPKLSQELINFYPISIIGSHRIHFDEFNITLTLIFDDALNYLKKANFQAHAWYLDGFSPNKNPQLWDAPIAQEVFRLTAERGTLSTYSAASIVRKNFSSVGFKISKMDGFGKKREMLTGIKTKSIHKEKLPYKFKNWLNTKPHQYKNKTAIVIGAGMAGCLISAALAKRNWQITLLDKHSSIANEGSGNPNAILMPRLSVDHDIQSQLTLQGFLYSSRYFNQLAKTSLFSWQQSGAIQLPRDTAQWSRMQTITQQNSIPHELLHPVSQSQASELCHCNVSKEGWHIPLAGSLTPALLCETLLELYKHKISFTKDTDAKTIEKIDGTWVVYDSHGKSFSADVVIIASGLAANKFSQTDWCSLNPKRGQITFIPEQLCNIQPKKIVCADAYVTPAVNSQLITGATFITNDDKTDLREHEHNENLEKLATLIPSFKSYDTEQMTGRAAIRAVSNDRLPVVGPVSIASDFFLDYKDAALGATHHQYPTSKTYQGLYMASGFGSRGLAWIPLCTESLACIINNEPNPIDNLLLQAIHPNRLLMKQLILQQK